MWSLARFTVNIDISVMLFDNPVYHRKSKSRPLPDFLRCKERLKYLLSRLSVHTGARIGNRYKSILLLPFHIHALL